MYFICTNTHPVGIYSVGKCCFKNVFGIHTVGERHDLSYEIRI